MYKLIVILVYTIILLIYLVYNIKLRSNELYDQRTNSADIVM